MNYIEKFMKDNDIEFGEEFYIKHKGAIEWARGGVKYHFDENYFLVSEEDDLKDFGHMNKLLTGSCKIEKIPHKPKSVWDLKNGDEYYYIDYYGEIKSVFNECCDEDLSIIEIGNAFLTREEAEFEAVRRKCEAVLLKYGTRDMRSLGDIDAHKYFIVYNNYYNELSISFNQSANSQGTIYFETSELAQKAIDEVTEERLKKYVFNVKE